MTIYQTWLPDSLRGRPGHIICLTPEAVYKRHTRRLQKHGCHETDTYSVKRGDVTEYFVCLIIRLAKSSDHKLLELFNLKMEVSV